MVKTRHLLVIKIQVPNLFLAYKILLSRSLISQVLFLFFFLLFEELSRVNFLVFFFFSIVQNYGKRCKVRLLIRSGRFYHNKRTDRLLKRGDFLLSSKS